MAYPAKPPPSMNQNTNTISSGLAIGRHFCNAEKLTSTISMLL